MEPDPSNLPDPIVEAHISLLDMDWFPFHHDLLMASELWALSSGDEFKAAMSLWCRAWKQKPAATLPNNNKVLAAFAGVTPSKWLKIREVAMRGFILCSDGRFHHTVLGDEAIKAWKRKESYSARGVSGNVQRSLKANKHEELRIAEGSLKDGSGIAGGSLQIAITRHNITEQEERKVSDPLTPLASTEPLMADVGSLAGSDVFEFSLLSPADQPAFLAKIYADRNPSPEMLEKKKLAEDARRRSNAQVVLAAFNALAAKHNFALAMRLNDSRIGAINARIEEAGGIDQVVAALGLIAKSSFLKGRAAKGQAGWNCNFDSVIAPAFFLKLSEGGFNDPKAQNHDGHEGGYAQGYG